ncbi:MAG TPA: aminoglycoside phosphotransferase family protein [Acidimicrobiia bacterium]|nr:aminoglycoside phosphotransferase family protein [Acidimicrobiia bacterium]
MPRDPRVLARELLGSDPDEIESLVVWTDRATHRVAIGAERFVVKTDDDLTTVAREVAGQRRAAGAGVRVPEVVAVAHDAFAMRWVDGRTLVDHSTPDSWHDAGTQIRLAHDLGGGGLPFGTGFGGFEPGHPTWREFFEAFAESMLRDCERDLEFPPAAAARIRDALRAAAPMLDIPHLAWCHGDLQPEHVIVDPATNRVAAIIDWADNGAGDVGWDVAVLTIDHHERREAFLAGYGASTELRAALDQLLPLYEVVRLVGEATWFAEHNFPPGENLRRAIEWRS